MDFPVWKTAWCFCGKQAETDECEECEEHFKSHGHHPNEVRCYQVPGQPRIVVRYCSECGKQL